MDEWISVKDRRRSPGFGNVCFILVNDNNQHTELGVLKHDGWHYWDKGIGTCIYGNVTHWRPLYEFNGES